MVGSIFEWRGNYEGYRMYCGNSMVDNKYLKFWCWLWILWWVKNIFGYIIWKCLVIYNYLKIYVKI